MIYLTEKISKKKKQVFVDKFSKLIYDIRIFI